MQIELKSNRHFIFKALLPIVILISVILISMIFVLVDDYGVWLDFRNDIIIISIGGLCEITAISIILFANSIKEKVTYLPRMLLLFISVGRNKKRFQCKM